MFEHTRKYTEEVNVSSDRTFGFVFASFFLIIATLPLLNDGPMRLWALGLSAAFALVSLISPKLLTPAKLLWLKFGELLHHVVSPLTLGIIFYLTVLPTGLLLRLLGKDPLNLRPAPDAESYWIKRDPPGPEADSLKNQF